MHPDRKIGFAMGILLIGVVAALFFRNEPLLTDDAPDVRRIAELNQSLRDRDAPVYLEDAPDASSDRPAGHQWSLKEFYDQMEERNGSLPQPIGQPMTGGSVPPAGKTPSPMTFEPPRLPTDDDEVKATSVSGSESGGKVSLDQLLSGAADATDPSSAGQTSDDQGSTDSKVVQYDEYTVQFGDTLSGIAEKRLGSPHRYREIFDANRDRISTPDRLNVGKAIRIPRVLR